MAINQGDASTAEASDRSALDCLLSPRSIAVIGASDRPGKLGTWVYDNVVRAFDGPVYPVSPRGGVLHGISVLTAVEELPFGVDMAIVIVSATQVVEIIEQCAARGVRGVTLLASGFAETGAEGESLQADLADVVARTGVRLVGPNCIGYMNLHGGVMANFAIPATTPMPPAGPVALVSQSGGFGAYITSKSLLTGLRLGWFVSTGNEVDVNIAAVLSHLVERVEVRVLMVFSETLRDPEVFIRAARRAHELDKPLILLKAGRSEEAARAAMSHTASIVGSAAVLDAVCRQYGVFAAHTMEEMLDLGLVFQDGRRSAGRNLGIVTGSGGAGVLLADGAALEGLAVPVISPEQQAKIKATLPQPFFGSVANPIDLTASSSLEASESALHALLDLDEVDLVAQVTWAGPSPRNDLIVKAYQESTKPFALLSTDHWPPFQDAGIPTFTDPRRVTHALGALARFSHRPDLDPPVFAAAGRIPEQVPAAIARAAGERLLLESDAKEVLAAYGAQVTRERNVDTIEAAVAAAHELGGAVALKVMSYQLPHKSDVGALRIGLKSEQDVREGYDSMLAEVIEKAPHAKVESILVQEMVPARLEMTCGLQRDPVFGPVVAVGLGGVTIEIMAAAEFLHVPFSHDTAVRTISGMLDGRLIRAARGLSDAEVDQLAGLMVAIGQLALDCPEITEIDVNPVRVGDGRAVAADALIVLGGSSEQGGDTR